MMTDFKCIKCGTVRQATGGRSFVECLECDGLAWAEGFGPDRFKGILLDKHFASIHNAQPHFAGNEKHGYVY